MEAFNAFQRKDYLLSAEKVKQLNQHFSDSPLRDVALLMLARSNQRAGDNEAAANVINQFSSEFGNSSLAGSVEEDLLSLGKRQKAGEKLAPNHQLQLAAHRVRNEQLAIERAAAEKVERERLAREKAERERLAREKAEAERRERERLAAVKAARDAIRFSIEPPAGELLAEVGVAATIPLELVNHGIGTEEFSLEGLFPPGLNGTLTAANESQKGLAKIQLAPKQSFKGLITVTLPGNRVDGSRQALTIKAASVKFNDLLQTRELQITAQAPLLRAVAKLQRPQVAPGESVSYRVTVLNVGSTPAKEIDLRISLPKQLKLIDAGENGCWIENEQLAACRISSIANGQLGERNLTVVVRDKAEGQNLRGTVEVLQTVLQTKESFQGAGFNIKQP
jgi:uncharacterized repeat protein (TIGR01451 family)